MDYKKPHLNYSQQLLLLKERGLSVDDDQRALRWLQRVSYYRLSAYFLPFKDGEKFRPASTFNNVIGLYVFDRKLRLLILDAIERIEVALRTAITYKISSRYGPFGHTNPENFAPSLNHSDFMKKLMDETKRAKKNETFVIHFRKKYKEEAHLPVWMATELLSFGTISILYKSMHPEIKRDIAGEYGLNNGDLASWLHSLGYVRNICAHHKRLWNRKLAIKPRLPKRQSVPNLHILKSNDNIYCIFVILQNLLNIISPNCFWRDRLIKLFDEHPDVSLASMKVPPDWRKLRLWRLKSGH